MTRAALELLRARAERIRARHALVAWELRQSARAKGAFDRLAAELARAQRCFAIGADDASALAREGWPRLDAGSDLHPSIAVYLLDAARAGRLVDARPLAIRLDGELLSSRAIALVPFAPWAHLARPVGP